MYSTRCFKKSPHECFCIGRELDEVQTGHMSHFLTAIMTLGCIKSFSTNVSSGWLRTEEHNWNIRIEVDSVECWYATSCHFTYSDIFLTYTNQMMCRDCSTISDSSTSYIWSYSSSFWRFLLLRFRRSTASVYCMSRFKKTVYQSRNVCPHSAQQAYLMEEIFYFKIYILFRQAHELKNQLNCIEWSWATFVALPNKRRISNEQHYNYLKVFACRDQCSSIQDTNLRWRTYTKLDSMLFEVNRTAYIGSFVCRGFIISHHGFFTGSQSRRLLLDQLFMSPPFSGGKPDRSLLLQKASSDHLSSEIHSSSVSICRVKAGILTANIPGTLFKTLVIFSRYLKSFFSFFLFSKLVTTLVRQISKSACQPNRSLGY